MTSEPWRNNMSRKQKGERGFFREDQSGLIALLDAITIHSLTGRHKDIHRHMDAECMGQCGGLGWHDRSTAVNEGVE